MSRRVALVVRIGRTHYFAGFQAERPFLTLGSERVLTDPNGIGVYAEWSAAVPEERE